MSRTTIRSISVEPLNIPLLEPFTIATGSVSEAQNVLITITLNDGSRALTRSYGIPLYVFFGGAGASAETDMSIPLVTPEHGYELAKDIVARGITSIKIKVGGNILDDVARVEAIREAAPGLGLTLDANQGYTTNEALLCLEALDDHDIRPLLMEQPVHKDDHEGLRYVTQHTTIPIAADESAYSAANVARLIEMRAVNVINIKLMKSGFVEALDIAAVCRANHIGLMIGAMIESRLATSAAAHFVAGLGGFRFIDLDTPMLLAEDPFTGGYVQRGGVYDLMEVERGLGVERR